MTFKPETRAGTWLNAAAVLSLVGGIITGLAFGTKSFGGDFFSAAATWVGWAFFACGFAGFALLAALAVIVERLTSIRYLLSLQVGDKLAHVDKTREEAKPQARPSPIRPGRGFE